MDFSNFRFRNLFDDQNNPFQNINFIQPPPVEQPYDAGARMNELYQPSNTAQEAFTGALNQMPQRQDYQPSMMRKIAGAIAGLGAVRPTSVSGGQPIGFDSNPLEQERITSQITDKPFNEAMSDWGNKIKPLEYSANLERQTNLNERELANQTVSREISAKQQETREKREAENERKNLENERQKDEEIKIRQQRADTYRFKVEHPDWKAVPSKGGTVHFVNPKNPEESVDTGIKTGTFSDMDKASIGFSNAKTLEQIKAENRKALDEQRAKEASDLESQRQGGRISAIDEKAKNAPNKTGTSKDSTTVSTTVIPGKEHWYGNEADQKKVTTTVRGQGSTKTPSATETRPEMVKRQKAIEILTTAKKKVDEDTIKIVMDQLK